MLFSGRFSEILPNTRLQQYHHENTNRSYMPLPKGSYGVHPGELDSEVQHDN